MEKGKEVRYLFRNRFYVRTSLSKLITADHIKTTQQCKAKMRERLPVLHRLCVYAAVFLCEEHDARLCRYCWLTYVARIWSSNLASVSLSKFIPKISEEISFASSRVRDFLSEFIRLGSASNTKFEK